jgi:hypothetical protein
VLELLSTHASVIGAFAEPAAIDVVTEGRPTNPGTFRARVASDEAMVVGSPDAGDVLVNETTVEVERADPHGMVLATTDGWVVWTLAGGSSREAFSRLSALRLEATGYTQGDVLHVPVRVITELDRVHLLVPAMSGDYVYSQVLRQCASLGVSHERTPVVWGGDG